MRFNKQKLYDLAIFDVNHKHIWQGYGHFSSKADAIEQAKVQAQVHDIELGHISICDVAEGTIVRYTPSGRIWG